MTDAELIKHLDEVSAEFKGNSSHLTSAIGAFWVGRVYGWRVLRIITSSPTYTRHQRILGIDFKKELPEITEYSQKSTGYKIVMELNKFWDVVRGTYSINPKEKELLQ